MHRFAQISIFSPLKFQSSLPSPSTRPCRLSIPVRPSRPGWPAGCAAVAVSARHFHGLPRCPTAFCPSARWRTLEHSGTGNGDGQDSPEPGLWGRLLHPGHTDPHGRTCRRCPLPGAGFPASTGRPKRCHPGRAVHRTAPTAICENGTTGVRPDDSNAVGAPRCCARTRLSSVGTTHEGRLNPGRPEAMKRPGAW